MSLKDKLTRMRTHMSLEQTERRDELEVERASQTVASVAHTDPTALSAHDRQWEALGAQPYAFAGESVFVRERIYPLTHQHGHYRFGQLYEAIARWQDAGIAHPLSADGLATEDLLFFDTETTGLQGGVGNAIFLLGTTRVTQDGVVMRQHFLPSPDAETALYHSFARDLAPITHLVTYNGKSFDWPQVRTRHTLLRGAVPALPALGHFDLLHGARRLWREDLESCRLSLIEPEKLGVSREHDVPGYMAPILYFDYLHSGDPSAIAGVLTHNEIDVLSLITLYIHLSTLLLGAQPGTYEEHFAIARWYEALGDDEAAAARYDSIAQSTHALRQRATQALGMIAKRRRDWRRAIVALEACATDVEHPVSIDVYVELAKLYEHQIKDYDKAMHYAKAALAACSERSRLTRRSPRFDLHAHTRRIERLARRLTEKM